ncbi:MAG TPA: hypothetical protein VGQ59_09975 [Cyclobacteriaceae bacterium]|nr:hypothetical protein [Cyclobacteriaceae bacterium]
MTALSKLDYIQFIVIDLFAGAGGTTLGFEMTDSGWEQFSKFLKANGIDHPRDKRAFFKMSEVVACVNHDPMAIISHHINNKRVVHFEEDITKLYGFQDHGVLFKTPQFKRMLRLLEMYRAFYPHAKIILWASLECTNFSKAKGGMSRDADSRTLANHLFPYILHLDPDYIQIENVVEFKEWGPLIPKVRTTNEGYEFCPLIQVKPKKKKKLALLSTQNNNHPDPDPVEPKKEEEVSRIYFAPHWIPDPATKGIWWLQWREAVNAIGYFDEWRQINAADHGAYTSRNRLFGCFAKHGLPMAWPIPTHGKKPEKSTIPLKKWKPVKDVLDFSDEGKSIFNRKKPISTKSMQRMFMGCVRHIAGGKENFISRYNGGKPESRNNSIDEPAAVITTNNRLALVSADFLLNYNHSSTSNGVNEPAPTVVASDKVAKVFISKYYSGDPEGKNISVEGPAGTIKCRDGQALVFISKYNGVNGGKHDNSHSIEEPVGALSTKERHAKISVFLSTYNSNKPEVKGGGNEGRSIENPAPAITTGHTPTIVNAIFIDQQFSQGKQNQSIEEPLGSLTTVPKHKIIQADFFIDKQYGGESNHQSVNQPAGTIMANDKHNLVKAEKFILNNGSSTEAPNASLTNGLNHFIINPSWGGNSGSIETPCHVVVARQDKAPLYLITCKEGPVVVPVYEDDCEWTIKIKEFMALYNISDILMRMLKEDELLPIQGFPMDYFNKVREAGVKLSGTDAKKFIGNAVHPLVPKAMCESLNEKLSLKVSGKSRKIAA